MGRLTWESLPKKPLPGRRNLVITSRDLPGVECFRSIPEAIETCADEDVWFIGGRWVYTEAMGHADTIDLTIVPTRIEHADAIYFPPINSSMWTKLASVSPTKEGLRCEMYKRKV